VYYDELFKVFTILGVQTVAIAIYMRVSTIDKQ
jgi:hypothetical protein